MANTMALLLAAQRIKREAAQATRRAEAAYVAALLASVARTVGAVVLAGIVWTGPKLTPAEAAKILTVAPGLANRTNPPAPIPDGPTVVIIDGSPTDGPFGAVRGGFRGTTWPRWSLGPYARSEPWGRPEPGRRR